MEGACNKRRYTHNQMNTNRDKFCEQCYKWLDREIVGDLDQGIKQGLSVKSALKGPGKEDGGSAGEESSREREQLVQRLEATKSLATGLLRNRIKTRVVAGTFGAH